MIAKNQAPHLRFPEFSEMWSTKKLATLVIKVGSGITPRGGSAVYVDEGTPLIRSQNVNNDQLDLNDVVFITPKIHASMSSSAVQPNDVLLNITGASIGRSCVVPLGFQEANVNQHVCIIRLKNSTSPDFLQKYLASWRGQKLIFQSQAGGGREGLNFGNIRSFKIAFPDLEEQRKIASFLGAADSKLDALRRKRALLAEYKRGVMQKLFSQQIRFTQPDGTPFPDWEMKKLGDFVATFSGGTPKSTNPKYYGGVIPFIKSGEISNVHTNQSITEAGLSNSSAKLVEEGDLLYALYGATSGEVAISKITGAINQAVLCIRSNQLTVYLYQLLLHSKERIVATYLQGGQGNLSADIVKSIKCNVPSIDEQQKISCFLTAVDDKITAVDQQIEQIETFKKGLLQQMFV